MKRNDPHNYVAIGGHIDSLLDVLTGWVVDVTLVDGREVSVTVADASSDERLTGWEYGPEGSDEVDPADPPEVSIPWSTIDTVDVP